MTRRACEFCGAQWYSHLDPRPCNCLSADWAIDEGWVPVDFEDGAREHDGVVLTFREIAGDAAGRPRYTGRRVRLEIRFDRIPKLARVLAGRDFLERKQWGEESDPTLHEVERPYWPA